MAHDDYLENSLPYIDDLQTDEETTVNQGPYNLKIIENYQNRNRNIEITNKHSEEVISKSLSPVAPLAEESELSDVKVSDEEEEEEEDIEKDKCRHLNTSLVPGQSGMKLVIKGWNSTIKIQGLDNKSSIVFKRKSERVHEDKTMKREQRRERGNGSLEKSVDGSRTQEKSRKGRWKMLTKSLIAKSARFERRGLDERYPKYVLLKDEEEEERLRNVEEGIRPKMIVEKEKRSKEVLCSEKENVKATKSEFNFKKSFKNKTKPVVLMEELLEDRDTSTFGRMASKEPEMQKRPLTERRSNERRNVTVKKKVIVERRKSFAVEDMVTGSKPKPEMMFNVTGYPPPPPPQGQVFNEIRGIFEDTLNLCPNTKGRHPDYRSKGDPPQPEHTFPSQTQPEQYYSSIPPQYCQFPCTNPCCHPSLDHPPVYVPVYTPYSKPGHVYKHSNTQTNENELEVPPPAPVLDDSTREQNDVEDLHLETLPFGLLSSFFPRVVIMKTFQSDDLGVEAEASDDAKGDQSTDFQSLKIDRKEPEDELKIVTTLEVPQTDLQIKSKMIKLETKPEPEDFQRDYDHLTMNEVSISDDEHKTKTDDSETTEYLNFNENDSPNNDLMNPTPMWNNPSKTETEEPETEDGKTLQKQNTEDDCKDSEEDGRNLSLTKIGYKMYDNLTKLSLKRENEINEKPEVRGRGSNGSETKKSPCNITLESNNRIIKVTVPEDELSFQIVNSEGPGIQIGVTNTSAEEEEKKIVDKRELWHPTNGKKRPEESVVPEMRRMRDESPKDSQKIRLSLADNKEVVLSIETNENDRKQEMTKQKSTKEMKVGTDDFDLAGGDFPCHFGTNYKNLSPRTGRLLKSLQERLEFGERERRFLAEKIKEQFLDRKFEEGILPGIFLVKQISPRANIPKKSSEVPSLKKPRNKIQGARNEERGQLREYYCEECLATMRIFEDENPSVKSMVDKFETIIQLESY